MIININVDKTVNAFQRLLPNNSFNIQERVESSEVFKNMERGIVDEQTFLMGFNELMQSQLEWAEFEPAWNAMIGDIPVQRLEVLEEVAKKHRIYLLSNTNSIHLRRVNKVVRDTIRKESIDHFFKKAYYSNQIGMRKPDREIYDFVLEEQNLDPKETIFLDDNIHNLEGAVNAGLAVCHVTSERGIEDLF